jgi:hypothetical protein
MTALAETADRQSLWSSTAGVLKKRVEIARWVTFAFSIIKFDFVALTAVLTTSSFPATPTIAAIMVAARAKLPLRGGSALRWPKSAM